MRCRYVRKIFCNEENGYTVAVFSTRDDSVPISARDKYLSGKGLIGFTAIGFSLPMTAKIEIEMEGKWETNDRGTQFHVDSFLEVVPRTKEGIIGYLSSGAVKGVKKKTAEAIYRKFGLETLEIMEHHPEQLLSIRGISEKKLKKIQESFAQNKVFRELMTFLAPYHVTPKKTNLILQKFKDESVEIIKERPYRLCAVKGFGFLTVDEIGKQICSNLNDPMRISGCISHILHEAMTKEGHLYLEQDELVRNCLDLLNRDISPPVVSGVEIEHVLYRLVLQKNIVIENEHIYMSKYYDEEKQTAVMIAKRLLKICKPINVEKELLETQNQLGIELSEKQKDAVRMVFNNSFSMITGGPGTGKSTVLKVILHIHKRLCKSEIKLMAPTGRAARRMVEATGHDNATTMHMALGLVGSEDYEPDFEYLEAGFIIVDEVSMVDMHLAYEFFRRLKSGSKVLFVGDVNQLPSVGAGDVFRQMITCGLIPVTVLDTVYRQKKQSSIPLNAKMIQANHTSLQLGDDFIFVSCKGAEPTADMVKKLYVDECSRNGIDNVMILSPFKKRSAAGVEELNRTLEDIINPPSDGKKELKIGNSIYRVGDKIMQNKNTELISNGDMGMLADIYEDEEGNKKITNLFTDNRAVTYEVEQMEMVEHANAITIHKAQGSECPVVIIPWIKAFHVMLKRNILYTAVTRAKSKVYLVGEWAAICQAIHNDDSGKRKTMLGRKIIRYYEKYRADNDPGPEMEQMKLAI